MHSIANGNVNNLKRKALVMLCTLAMHWCCSDRFWRFKDWELLSPKSYCLQVTGIVLNQIVEKAKSKPWAKEASRKQTENTAPTVFNDKVKPIAKTEKFQIFSIQYTMLNRVANQMPKEPRKLFGRMMHSPSLSTSRGARFLLPAFNDDESCLAPFKQFQRWRRFDFVICSTITASGW